jgi:lathosterol oxidase
MLCEIASNYGFIALWATMTFSGFAAMMVLSTIIFIPYYVNPTFERWLLKCNPKFPSPALIKKEIVHMTKGLVVATLIPSFTLFASFSGLSKGYCGDPHNIGLSGFIVQAAIIFGFTDLAEYAYHWLGHRYKSFWEIHKHHHSFFNPSPFAVIADEWPDQFMRTLPMAILPTLMPINMDLLFGIFATLFYGYGVYLHWGYESSYLSTHNPIFNTSYHHYHHHAVSVIGKPVYTGFFFKIWDNLFHTLPSTPCACHECRPKRTKEEWNATLKPDYSVLLSPSWWINTTIDVKE